MDLSKNLVKTDSLNFATREIICNKSTEYPNTGEYTNLDIAGTYLCRQCGLALFRSEHKFHSGCGWPSFDAEILGTVKRELDSDGRRTEILCIRCNAHLGHVFQGEGYTPLSTRHCVNSLSLDFVESLTVEDSCEAIIAGGCFWGIEYYFKKLPGVLKTEVGYSGGSLEFPEYKEVCDGRTQHLEVVRVIFDTAVLSYTEVIKYFFEIHDPTQIDGQGPDVGSQYLSAIFYYNQEQLDIAKNLIIKLEKLGYKVVTKLKPVSIFWPAEAYHQDYYNVNQKLPYCHTWQDKFSK